MNRVVLIGRLTSDPVIRYTQSQTPVASYTLAVDRVIKKEGQPEADFINCIAWNKTAEFAERYLFKGTKIAVEGHIQTGSYEKDGVKHYTTDVIVERHEFCESKSSKSTNQSSESYESSESSDFGNYDDDGDLPF